MCGGDFIFDFLYGGGGVAFSYPWEAQSHLTVASGTLGEGKPLSHSSFFRCRRRYHHRNGRQLLAVTPRYHPGLLLRGSFHWPAGWFVV